MTVAPNIALTWQDYTANKHPGEHTVVGNLKGLPRFWSPQQNNYRDLLVYLPPSYNQTDHRYPVIYMHDGQNLFDAHTSFSGEWQVDETMQRLSREGLEAIIVGLPNMGRERLNEYSPFQDERHGGGQGDNYLAFITDTVKPRIDRDFRTLPDRRHTGLLGSSMGGLISLYGFFRYPSVFGLVGAMSPSLWFANRAIFAVVKESPYMWGKIYLDTGTHEYTGFLTDRVLFRIYSRRQRARLRHMRGLLRQKGYVYGQDLLYLEEEDAEHHEAAWARRLPNALRFLLAHT